MISVLWVSLGMILGIVLLCIMVAIAGDPRRTPATTGSGLSEAFDELLDTSGYSIVVSGLQTVSVDEAAQTITLGRLLTPAERREYAAYALGVVVAANKVEALLGINSTPERQAKLWSPPITGEA